MADTKDVSPKLQCGGESRAGTGQKTWRLGAPQAIDGGAGLRAEQDPPAGAAALLFSSGERSWQQIGMMLVGNVVAIACAALVNNSYEKRQYPTFWGLKPILDHFPSLDVFRAPESDPKTKKA